MKTKTVKVLPKMASEIQNGGVYQQRIRCGKSNCKCSRGETHTAFYFFSRRNNKLTKIYIPKSEVEKITGIVKKARCDRENTRQINKSNSDLLKKLRENLREKEILIKLLREKI